MINIARQSVTEETAGRQHKLLSLHRNITVIAGKQLRDPFTVTADRNDTVSRHHKPARPAETAQ